MWARISRAENDCLQNLHLRMIGFRPPLGFFLIELRMRAASDADVPWFFTFPYYVIRVRLGKTHHRSVTD
jgi:hypothetical protein